MQEGEEGIGPRSAHSYACLDRPPCGAGAVVRVILDRALGYPRAHLSDEGLSVVFVSGGGIRSGQIIPKRHPVQLPLPFIAESYLGLLSCSIGRLGCGGGCIEMPVDLSIRKGIDGRNDSPLLPALDSGGGSSGIEAKGMFTAAIEIFSPMNIGAVSQIIGKSLESRILPSILQRLLHGGQSWLRQIERGKQRRCPGIRFRESGGGQRRGEHEEKRNKPHNSAGAEERMEGIHGKSDPLYYGEDVAPAICG